MQSITSQSDQYGLTERQASELPAEEHLAAVLNKPPMFSGPARVEDHA